MSGLPESFVPGWHDEAEVRKMKFRTLPHYGQVSVISFGASGLGGMFTAGQGTGLADAKAGAADEKEDVWFAEDAEADKQAAKDIVQMCLKAGVNIIDTSHWYGQGRSERLLGHALKGVPRQAFYINSKIGRYDKDPMHMFDFTYEKTYQAGPASPARSPNPDPTPTTSPTPTPTRPQPDADPSPRTASPSPARRLSVVRAEQAVLDSLKRLQLECIDSMQVHDPEFAPSVDVIVTQTLPALQRLKEEGKIKYVGVTGYPLETQREIIERSIAAGALVSVGSSWAAARGWASGLTSLSYCHYANPNPNANANPKPKPKPKPKPNPNPNPRHRGGHVALVLPLRAQRHLARLVGLPRLLHGAEHRAHQRLTHLDGAAHGSRPAQLAPRHPRDQDALQAGGNLPLPLPRTLTLTLTLTPTRRSRCAGRKARTWPSSPCTSAYARSASPPRSSRRPRSRACVQTWMQCSRA